MTDDIDPNDWLRAAFKGELPPAEPEPPETPPKPAPSFHGGPRITALPPPDPSAQMNALLREALARHIQHRTVI